MNVLEKAARIIDPDAFEEPHWKNSDGSEPSFSPLEKSRKEYHRSRAICRAFDVLKLALKTPGLREELVQIELDDWDKLGVPIRKYAGAVKVVEEKYA
jgi:hypothetical protein